jgi:hypothetical protein
LWDGAGVKAGEAFERKIQEWQNRDWMVGLAANLAFPFMATWTESLAVGTAGFVERIKRLRLARTETEVTETAHGQMALQEWPAPYGQETA